MCNRRPIVACEVYPINGRTESGSERKTFPQLLRLASSAVWSSSLSSRWMHHTSSQCAVHTWRSRVASKVVTAIVARARRPPVTAMTDIQTNACCHRLSVTAAPAQRRRHYHPHDSMTRRSGDDLARPSCPEVRCDGISWLGNGWYDMTSDIHDCGPQLTSLIFGWPPMTAVLKCNCLHTFPLFRFFCAG